MPTLNPNSWSQRDWDDLDRHITGNWEGNHMSTPNDQDPPEDSEMQLVYIREVNMDFLGAVGSSWHIYDARTSEELISVGSRHDAIDYCNDQGWDVRDGPINDGESEDDDSLDAMDFDIEGGPHA